MLSLFVVGCHIFATVVVVVVGCHIFATVVVVVVVAVVVVVYLSF